MPGQHLPALLDPGAVDATIEVVGKGLGELGLSTIQLQHPLGQCHLIQHGRCGFRGNACLQGRLFEGDQAGLEVSLTDGGRGLFSQRDAGGNAE